MVRGKYVVLIPAQISTAGAKQLTGELKGARVGIVGKDDEVVLAEWGAKAKAAVAKGLSVQAFLPTRSSPLILQSYPHTRRESQSYGIGASTNVAGAQPNGK